MKRKYISVARNKAVELICSNLHYLQTQEIVTLSNALNRVAAKDIKSFNTLPNTMNSRWDCVFFYYDRWLEDKGDTSLWQLGKDYIYANTGVAIKGDHDTGVKVENTKIDKDNRLVLLEKNIQKGQNTQPVGEWLKEGEIVVKANTKILPAHLNILATAGVIEVPVYRKPKVGFIATGNELVSAGQNLPVGKNIESNSISIAAKCILWGAEPISLPIVSDNKAQIAAAIHKATAICDIVIIGAGTARGTEDYTLDLMDSLGTVFFHEVDHGPGKRTSFTVVNNTPVIGLVGPPMGEEMTFDFYVLPAILECLHQKIPLKNIKCLLEEDLPEHPKVDFYMPLHIYEAGDICHAVKAESLPGSGAMILCNINAYYFLPRGCGGRKKGEIIEAELSPSIPIAKACE